MNDLKQKFILDKDITFLNHGSFGACPIPVFEDYQNWQRELEKQPVKFLTKSIWSSLRNSRTRLGEFVGCDEGELLFFHNPTTAIANVINSLRLNTGEEVLMTDHEYGALVRQWNVWGKKNGIGIIQQKIPLPVHSEQEFVDSFWRGVNKNTRVIFISQITSPTAIIFPIDQIIKKAKKKGILTIVDGAHVPGHIDINIHDLGCDFYTGAIHKWLCGPKGSSFLYVNKSHHDWVKPIIYSWGRDGDDPGPSEFLQDFQWQGTRDMSSFLTIPRSIEFYTEHIQPLQLECRQMILESLASFESVLGTRPITIGDDWIGKMVSHPLPSSAPRDLKDILWNEYRIEIPIFDWGGTSYIRSSIQVYNEKKDVESLMNALDSIL
ncbi:MAG: aminotransferase [Candidatus Marinimicrobia bacterium]|nr:aminotransferase [Candidatus Neomarinimicrobiota bacterium]